MWAVKRSATLPSCLRPALYHSVLRAGVWLHQLGVKTVKMRTPFLPLCVHGDTEAPQVSE